MFGIGGSELLVILVVALVVLGPKSLPRIAANLGKALGAFRRASTEFQRTLNFEELEEEEREREKRAAQRNNAPASSPSEVDDAQPKDTGASTSSNGEGRA